MYLDLALWLANLAVYGALGVALCFVLLLSPNPGDHERWMRWLVTVGILATIAGGFFGVIFIHDVWSHR